MNKILEEKRAHPRIKASLKVETSKNIAGNSVDLSEGGASFSSTDVIASPSIHLQIHFSDIKPEFKTNAKLVWKRDMEGGNSLYGVEFVGLNEIQKALLRKELIKTQIIGSLTGIKNAETKKEIYNFFLKDVLGYISEVIKLTPPLSKESEYSAELEEKLKHLNDQLVLKGYCLEEQLSDKITMQKAKDNFRHLLGAWAYKSAIMKRGFDKPRGYPGDYKMLAKFNKTLKVIMVTGADLDAETKAAITELGVSEYLHKPVLPPELSKALVKVLA